MYVGLGAGNGGIVINLGAGGLSLQAVAELNPETELTLYFRMQGAEHAIETTGRVTWLGPTQKEAGICFKNLSDDTERQIVEWIARLEEPAQSMEIGTESRPEPSPTSGEAPVQLIQASQPDDSPIAPDDATPLPAPRSSTIRLRVLPREGLASQLRKSVESHAEHSDPPLRPATPRIDAKEILPRDAVLPSWIPSFEITSASGRVSAAREPSAPESHRGRWKFAISVAATVVGILALIVVVSTLSKLLGPGGSGGRPVGPISPPAAIAPGKTPRTEPAVRTGHGANSAPPIPATREAVSVPRDDGWVARLKDFLGMDVPAKIDPAIVNVPVWTIQRSGFYYCGDSPDFEKVRQSAVMMTQGKALQSGYQPKLGSYCQ
jgi:hypothetical protein